MKSKEFIRGTIKTIVLKLLAENKRMYGYEITQRVEELSNNEIHLTYGALYPILYKMEEEGLLVTESEIVENRARKYYSLTKEGNEVAKVKVSELGKFADIIKTILLPAPKPTLEAWGI